MSKLTRSGVAYDLTVSPHKTLIVYDKEDHLEFVFSSELYMNIFERKVEENREKINESLSKRFGYEIEVNKLADLKLYVQTEKRGFLILGKEEFNCLNNIKLNGVNLITKN